MTGQGVDSNGLQLNARGTRASRKHLRFMAGPLFVLAGLALMASVATAAPTVAIVSPSEAATIDSATVPLALDIQNFTLNGSAVGGAPVTDEGHYHLYVDGAYVKFDFTTSTFLADVAEGAHRIDVELANNDHSLLGINASVNVTISAGAPRLRIVSPASSASWNSNSLELQVSVQNFVLDAAAVGQAPAAGRGHYHVLVNGAYFFFGTTEFFNVTYMTPGSTNVIRVELYNNDHSSISPPIYDEITITIPAGAPEFKLDPLLFQANVNASSLFVGFTVANFTIDPTAVGGAPVAGRGHYHAWLDGVFLGPAALNPLPLTDLSVGAHTLVLELRNNDHSQLSPRVVDFTMFTVVASAPRVTITGPADPSTVNASSLTATFTVGNFTLDGTKAGQSPEVGIGHWHVLIDGVYAGFGGNLEAMVSDLSQGPHVISIELRNNDHSALAWPTFDMVRISVAASAPKVTITSPGAAVTVSSSSVALNFTVANFTLDAAKVGQAPEAGIGHWHLLVDGAYSGFGASLSALAVRLSPGTHVISIELRNNDHSALAWPAFDLVTVTVPDGAPWVSIVSPAAGGTVPMNFTWINVSVANLTMVDFSSGPANAAGQGHLHVYLDGALYTMSSDLMLVVSGLSAGSHTLRVELAQNDHTPLTDAAVDEVTFTATGLRASITLTAPAAHAIIYGNSTTVTATVANFTLSGAHVGQANVEGEGHWHVLVDGVYSGFSAAGSADLTGLAAGDRVIRVQLFNNDHSSLGVAIFSEVLVHVANVPSVRISSPAGGTEVTGTTLSLTVVVTNFTLVDFASGPANAAGQGHLHVYVDGTLAQMVSTTNVTLTNLTAGNHTIRVVLAQNDHTELAGIGTPPTITISAKAATTPPPPGGFLPGLEAALVVPALALAALLAVSRRRRTN